MNESREASLPEYINMLVSNHRAANEYCDLIRANQRLRDALENITFNHHEECDCGLCEALKGEGE